MRRSSNERAWNTSCMKAEIKKDCLFWKQEYGCFKDGYLFCMFLTLGHAHVPSHALALSHARGQGQSHGHGQSLLCSSPTEVPIEALRRLAFSKCFVLANRAGKFRSAKV